jgi:hypothetical protein
MSEEFFHNMAKTYIENWPSLLFNESIATAILRLNNKEVNSLIETNIYTIEQTGKAPSEETISIIRQLEDKLTGYISRFPRGAFVKLGSRSPKDSYIGCKEGFCCREGHKAIKLFNDSERIHDDLLTARHYGYQPHIAVREWIDIPEWAEFRGFIKNRKLIGLSQYNYLNMEAYPEIIQNADSIEWAIRRKVERIAGLLPLPDIVADFCYKARVRGNERINEVILIELNPFDFLTDPCLFNWNLDDFKTFQFRYISKKGEVVCRG